MKKINFDEVDCFFYEQNLFSDSMPLVKIGSNQLTTRQTKNHIGNIIDLISAMIEAGAIADERLEKYSTVLSVLKAIKAVFNRGNPKHPTIEMAKITIDVVKELALMEVTDKLPRAGIKSAAFVVKLLIDKGDFSE